MSVVLQPSILSAIAAGGCLLCVGSITLIRLCPTPKETAMGVTALALLLVCMWPGGAGLYPGHHPRWLLGDLGGPPRCEFCCASVNTKAWILNQPLTKTVTQQLTECCSGK